MWTVEVIKERFVEAAEVEHRMYVKGMTNGGNGWPSYLYDDEDRNGWDDQAKQDALAKWQGRKVTKSPELSRWEEVFFEWTPMIPELRRSLVWRWAQCRASGRSFSEYCAKKGVTRMTAYNRIDRVFENLATAFLLEGRLMRRSDGTKALHPDLVEAPNSHTMDGAADDAAASKAKLPHQPYRTDKHRDNLNTPEAVEAFQQHVDDHNDRMRRRRERSMRGVPQKDAA